MNQIKFGIIGCGKIGERHAKHISKVGKLESVCDIKLERAKKLGKKYHCSYYNDIDEFLENGKGIDIISICTPNGLHAEHSIKCLKSGFNVLCEKPMAISIRDCVTMIEEAEKANKRLFIVKQNRFNPPVEALKKVIDEGRLGKIFSVQLNCFWNRDDDYFEDSDWKGTKKLDGGVLYTQFSHFIDLLYWLIGDVIEVYAFGGNYHHKKIIEFEDAGVVVLRFESGVIGTINYTVNSYKKNLEGSITIFAEKGTVKVGGQYLNLLEYQNIKGFKIKKLPKSGGANNYGKYKGSMSNHDKVYKNVIDVLNNGAEIKTNGFEGLKSVEIIDKIYKSMKLIE